MNTEKLIPLGEFCLRLGIETSFILSLQEHGLVTTITEEQTIYIDILELPKLEKLVRLHEELDINIPGIEAITNLLDRIEIMQSEIANLNNRLRLYE